MGRVPCTLVEKSVLASASFTRMVLRELALMVKAGSVFGPVGVM